MLETSSNLFQEKLAEREKEIKSQWVGMVQDPLTKEQLQL
jgi:hypothetical protein